MSRAPRAHAHGRALGPDDRIVVHLRHGKWGGDLLPSDRGAIGDLSLITYSSLFRIMYVPVARCARRARSRERGRGRAGSSSPAREAPPTTTGTHSRLRVPNPPWPRRARSRDPPPTADAGHTRQRSRPSARRRAARGPHPRGPVLTAVEREPQGLVLPGRSTSLGNSLRAHALPPPSGQVSFRLVTWEAPVCSTPLDPLRPATR